MNILAIADFHRNDALKDGAIKAANSGEYNLFIGVGDYETPEYYTDLVTDMEIPAIALTGNWDFDFEPPGNEEYERLFNYKEVEFQEYRIVLLGSVYPDDYQERVREFFDGVDQQYRIIASHYPPHMLGDLADTGNRAGFPEFRELLMKVKPALWLCGHIHEDYGEFNLLNTTVLNCAAKESGKGWRIEMGEDGVESTEEVVLDEALAEAE